MNGYAQELPGWIDRHQAIDPKESPEPIHETLESIARKIKGDKFWGGLILGVIVIWLLSRVK